MRRKIGLGELIWHGINITVGIHFVNVYYKIFSNKSGIGYFIFLVIILSGILAYSIGTAFARLSTLYTTYGDGASHVYVRENLGTFWGWVVGVLQYLTLPCVSALWILGMFTVALDQIPWVEDLGVLKLLGFIGKETLNNRSIFDKFGHVIPRALHTWGYIKLQRVQDLILNAFGLAVYVLIGLSIVIFSLRGFRWIANVAGVVKWIISFLFFSLIVYLTCVNGVRNYWDVWENSAGQLENWWQFAENFNNAFVIFFFFYLGFETFSVVNENIENPKLTISKAIKSVVLLSVVIYFIVTFFFIGAQGNIDENNINPMNKIVFSIFGIIGPLILFVYGLTVKINGAAQHILYAGSMLEPLSTQGLISEKIKKRNSDGIPVVAAIFHLIAVIFLTSVLIILPFFIVNEQTVKQGKISSIRDFAELIGFVSFFQIIIYLLVLISCFRLAWLKRFGLKEIAGWIGAFVFLCYFLIFKLWSIIENSFFQRDNGQWALTDKSVQLFTLVGIFVFIICWYVFYYRRRIRLIAENDSNK